MNYLDKQMLYIIRYINDESIIGKSFPQIGNLSNHQRFINKARDYFPDIDYTLEMILGDEVKLTKILSSSLSPYRGWLIEREIKNIIKNYLTIDHKFYDVSIKGLNEESIYTWMHVLPSVKGKHILDYVLFDKSILLRCDFVGEPLSTIQLNSKEDAEKTHKKLLEQDEKLRFEKIYLKKDFPDLDFWGILKYSNYFFVSERLKAKLEEVNNLGVEFIKVENVQRENYPPAP
jgi:hypothetical protein